MSSQAVYVLPACRANAIALAPNLREIDKRECKVLHGVTPEVGLKLSLAASMLSYTAFDRKDEPIGMFGVGRDGAVWCVSTDAIYEPAVTLHFLRNSRFWIDRFHETYPLLWNHIHAENHLHIKWLQWLGFTFIRRFTVKGEPFYEFVKLKCV